MYHANAQSFAISSEQIQEAILNLSGNPGSNHINLNIEQCQTSKQLVDHGDISSDGEIKARSLFALAQSNNLFPFGQLTVEDFNDVVKVIEGMPGKEYFIEDQSCGIKLGLSSHKTGQKFLHFKEFDPRATRGGYKKFYRSIQYDREQVVANLESSMGNDRMVKSLTRELEVFAAIKESSYLLSMLDYTFYPKKVTSAMGGSQHIKVISYQTPLYDGDLRGYSLLVQNVPFEEILQVSRKAAKALVLFHKANFIHRDVKPGNFFYKGKGVHKKVVLADYGLAQKVGSEKFGQSLAGTRGFIDPQSAIKKISGIQPFLTEWGGRQSDYFSLGMTLYSFFFPSHDPLRLTVRKINLLALPKRIKILSDKDDNQEDANQGKVSFFKSVILSPETLKKEWMINFEKAEKNVDEIKSNEKRIFLKEVLTLMHPMANKRISGSTFFKNLSKLKKDL